jgi:hypothetical protein
VPFLLTSIISDKRQALALLLLVEALGLETWRLEFTPKMNVPYHTGRVLELELAAISSMVAMAMLPGFGA